MIDQTIVANIVTQLQQLVLLWSLPPTMSHADGVALETEPVMTAALQTRLVQHLYDYAWNLQDSSVASTTRGATALAALSQLQTILTTTYAPVITGVWAIVTLPTSN
jgi:hypothetical protein